jgi:hypothetical protein
MMAEINDPPPWTLEETLYWQRMLEAAQAIDDEDVTAALGLRRERESFKKTRIFTSDIVKRRAYRSA